MSRKALRLLLLHDSADEAESLLREVQRGAYSVTYDIVNTAQGMRNALEGATWDFIISDYSMPGFTALDALAVLKATRQDIPFIVVSDTIGEEGAVQALTAGASDFLVKGRLTRLLSTMSRLLMEAAARAERQHATEALRSEEAVAEFAGQTAHELNDVLTAILGFGGLLVEQTPAGAPGAEELREIVRAAERGAALTQRLRALSRRQPVVLSKPNPSAAKASPVVTPGASRPDSETILLIDDEVSVRTFARIALSRGGYTIIEAADAEAAVALLGAHGHPIDLVLTDIVLPGMNGRDLARHVAATSRDVRILLMTGHTGAHERGETKGRRGDQDFTLLEKPFTAQSLVAKVREVMREPVAVAR